MSYFGVSVSEKKLNLNFFDEEEINSYSGSTKEEGSDIFINGTNQMDVQKLNDLIHGRL